MVAMNITTKHQDLMEQTFENLAFFFFNLFTQIILQTSLFNRL